VEVERELVLDAPVDEVWEALTDAERLEEWFANDVDLDLERGDGVFRWDSGERRRAELDDVEPGRRLSFRWWDDDRPGEGVTAVSFTLVAVPDGTRLVVREATLGPTACAREWSWALELRAGALLLAAA
jgi:uncharacterized protein YndB with AHSA1/START domain